jgi:hypothetical protein
VFGCLWILLSDKAVESLFSDPEAIIRISMLKGWLYVAATSLLLFLLLETLPRRKLHASLRREVDNLRDRQRTHDLLAAITEHSDDAIFAKDLAGPLPALQPRRQPLSSAGRWPKSWAATSARFLPRGAGRDAARER